MDITLLKEPLVEFADNFLCDDPKKGITETGFYSLSNNTHNSEIHYSIIGTNQNIEDFKTWIHSFQNPIEASAKEIKIKDNTEIEDDGTIADNGLFSDEDFEFDFCVEENVTKIINKKLNPDFPGFNKDSIFKCEFLLDSSNVNAIKKTDIDTILKSKSANKEKSQEIIDLYISAYQEILEYGNKIPDICYIIVPSEVYKKLASIKNGKSYLNFRRQLKARTFACNGSIPIQIVLEDTITGSKKSMQDLSMTAWNFVVAQYYKTGNSIPWTLTDVDSDTCFIGISFHKIFDGENKYMRSSIAQAFNKDGKGLIFTGKQFEWNSKKTRVSTPHLQYDYAKELISNVLNNYVKINKHTPKRVVIHKTSDFWDAYKHKDYAEIDGFTEGIQETLNVNVDIDFVTAKAAKQKLFRETGEYPVMRGTLLKIDTYKGVLYTTGYIPYYESYPGVHIPMGIHIETIGETTLTQICQEILALTKLNFNNCNYYSSLPITLQFSQKVGEILQYLPEGIEPPNRYFYYM